MRIFSILLFIIVLYLKALGSPSLVFAGDVRVAAFIGENEFTLFGYSSPKAKVHLEGVGIYDTSYTDNKGYFEFKNRFSPLSKREVCLSAKDQLGRLSLPVCLPPFPKEKQVVIGPVILAPTISSDKDTYFVDDSVIISGQTMPNTDVDFSFFTNDLGLSRGLSRKVYASSLPILKTKSDSQGNFNLALSASEAENFRIFARANFDNNSSSGSNFLNIKIFSIFTYVIYFLKERLIELIVGLQLILLIAYFSRRYFHPHVIIKSKSIVLAQNNSLAIELFRINSLEEIKRRESLRSI